MESSLANEEVDDITENSDYSIDEYDIGEMNNEEFCAYLAHNVEGDAN